MHVQNVCSDDRKGDTVRRAELGWIEGWRERQRDKETDRQVDR